MRLHFKQRRKRSCCYQSMYLRLFIDQCPFCLLYPTSRRRALLNSFVYGITFGFSQSIQFFMHAVVFRFGAFQVTQSPDHFAFIEFYDVFRVFIAVVFGAFTIGQAGAFAPNYAKAKVSANRIFALLDLKPAIDSYSEEGDELVSLFAIRNNLL